MTDVTPAGPVPVPPFGLYPPTTPVAAAGDRVFFTHNDPAGPELWVSDGTAAGTRMVADLSPGPRAVRPNQLTVVATGWCSSRSARAYGPTPVTVLDRRDRRRHRAARLPSAGVYRPSRSLTGGKLFFTSTAQDRTTTSSSPSGRRTARSPGRSRSSPSAGTNVLPELHRPGRGVGGVDRRQAVLRGQRRQAGTELWVSDGTAAGTRLVKDINPTAAARSAGTSGGPASRTRAARTRSSSRSSASTRLLRGRRRRPRAGAVEDRRHRRRHGDGDGPQPDASGSPWYDLSGHPVRVADHRPAPRSTGGSTSRPTTASAARSSTPPTAPPPARRRSPPSPATPAAYWLTGGTPTVLAALGGRVLFSIGDAAGGRQLWATDGTAAGTAMVKPIGSPDVRLRPVTAAGPRPRGRRRQAPVPRRRRGERPATVGDRRDRGRHRGWSKRLNPTDLGSDPDVVRGRRREGVLRRVADEPGRVRGVRHRRHVRPACSLLGGSVGRRGSYLTDVPRQFTALRRRGRTSSPALGTTGRQLWVTDGTAAGTRMVKEIAARRPTAPGSTTAPGIDNLTDVAGTLFFTVDLPGSGQQLWKTDGTAAGTRKLVNGEPEVGRRRRSTAPSWVQTWRAGPPADRRREPAVLRGRRRRRRRASCG